MALRATTAEQRAEVLALLKKGELSQKEIAARVDVSKNVVSGIADRAHLGALPSTRMSDRLDALNAKMDAINAEFRAKHRRYYTAG